MASTSFFSSFCGVRLCFHIAIIACGVFLCLPTMTTALPMKDVIGQAMMGAKLEKQQQQQHHHLKKRAVTKTDCAQPTNLEAMFQEINSKLNRTQFLQKPIGGQAITIPASETAKFIEGDPNESKTCPSTLTRDDSAPLAHRSLCPFYFDILQLPEGYYPRHVNWARCKCERCIENNAFACEEIKTHIAILKPVGCLQGMQRYEEEIIEVRTGCTCAFGGSSTANLPIESTTTTTAAPFSWGVN